MVPRTRIHWVSREGQPLCIELHGGDASTAAPVLFVPGLDLPRDWSFYPYLIEQIAQERQVLLAQPPQPYSLSAELRELSQLVAALGSGDVPPGVAWDGRTLGVCGHAKGGALALLLAGRCPSIGAVVAISPVCTLHRDAHDEAMARDLEQHGELFALEAHVRELRVPVMLITGEEDSVSPPGEAERLYHWLPKETGRLVMLEKTGHSLGADATFHGSNKELDTAVRVTKRFFEQVL